MKRYAFLMLGVLATGCGGGGGGDGENFIGAATVSLTVDPQNIDTGDRTELRSFVSEVHENGIALKFRYPEGLRYVPESAFLELDEEEVDMTPTVNTTVDGDTFLVFYLSQKLFTDGSSEYNGESAMLRLQLEGTGEVSDGSIEVDADVDDPAEDNSVEFNVNAPEFVAEDEDSIQVVD